MKNIVLVMLLGIIIVNCGGGGSSSSSGGGSAPPVEDTIPDSFSFTAQSNIALGLTVDSNPITIRGINTASEIKVSGALYQVNGGAFTDEDGLVANGDVVVLRITAASELATEVAATLDIGGVTATFSVTTVTVSDSTPDSFVIHELTAAPLNVLVESQAVTPSGFNVPVAISIEGGEYAIAGNPFTAVEGILNPGQSVIVRHRSADEFTVANETTLTIGGIQAVFRSVTAPMDTTPDAFTFALQSSVPINTQVESASITITGINSPTNVSVVDGEYSIDGGPYTSDEGVVNPEQNVRVRHQSGGDFSVEIETQLTIGGVMGVFISQTIDPDTTPDPFSFAEKLDVEPNTLIVSDSVTIEGINQPATISIVDGLYAIGDGPFTDEAGTVSSGELVYVQHTSATGYSAARTTTLNVGGVTAEFTSMTWPIGTGFNQATGFDGEVYAAVEAVDNSGDIYVVGNFSSFNNRLSGGIIRLNADGSVDEAFVVNQGFSSVARVVLPVNDGSGDIYVGGSFREYNEVDSTGIIRLNADGSVDTDFDTDGTGFGSGNAVSDIAFATDNSGDIYVVGSIETYRGESTPGIVRLNSDGSIDENFNVGNGFNGDTLEVLTLNNGNSDIYVTTSATSYNDMAIAGLVRLNSNGTIDTGFNTGTGFNRLAISLALATDGSGDIYVGGYFDTYNDIESEGVLRLNPNGSIDSVYQANREIIDFGVRYLVNTNDGSGDLYVAGSFSGPAVEIKRINSDGSIDDTFSVGSGFDSRILNLSMLEGGQLFVAGQFFVYDEVSAKGLVLLNTDGTLDSRFHFPTGFNDSVRKIVVPDDGSANIYALGGFDFYRDQYVKGLVQLGSNGIETGSYSLADIVYSTPNDISPVGDGSGSLYVLAQEEFTSPSIVLRVDAQGNVDTGSTVTLESSGAHRVAAANDGTGDIYIAIQENSTSDLFIRRYNSDGTLDTNFFPVGSFDPYEFEFFQPAGTGGGIYIGGDFTSYAGQTHNRIIKLSSDGSVDENFNAGSGFNRDVLTLVPARDESGKIYVGGSFSQYQDMPVKGVVRLNSNGTLDTTFNADVVNVRVITLTEDNSGKLYVSNSSRNIQRIYPDGSMDESFNTGSGFDFTIYDIKVAKDGSDDVFVGGIFNRYQNTTVDYIVRLNPDGSLND